MGGGASKKNKGKNAKKPTDADGPPDISAAALRRRRVLFGHEAMQEFENVDIWKQYDELPADDDRVFNRFEHVNGGLHEEANKIRRKMRNIRNSDGYLSHNVLELLQIGIGSDQKVARRLYEIARVERPSKRQLLLRSGTSTDLEKDKPPPKEEEALGWQRHECIGCYEFLALHSVIRFGDIDELLELLFCFFDVDEDDRVSVTDFEATIQIFLSLSSKGGKFRDALLKLDLPGTELDEYHKLDEAKQRLAIHRSAEVAVWKYGSAEGEVPPETEEAGDLEEDTESPAPAPSPPPPTETVEQPNARKKKKKSGRGFCKGKQPDSDTETEETDVKEEKDDEEGTDSKGLKDEKGENDSKTKRDSKNGKDGKAEKDIKKALVGEDDSENSSDEVGRQNQDRKEEEKKEDKAQKVGCCGSKKKKGAPKKEADKKHKEQTDTVPKVIEGVDAEKKERTKKLLDEDSDEEEAISKPKDSGKDPKGLGTEQSKAQERKEAEAAKANAEAKAKAKAKARKSSGGGCLPCCRARPKAASDKTPPPLTFDQWKHWFVDFVEVPAEVFDKKGPMAGPGEFAREATSTTLLPDRQMTGFAPSQQYPTMDTRQGYPSHANNMPARGFERQQTMLDRSSSMQQPLLEQR